MFSTEVAELTRFMSNGRVQPAVHLLPGTTDPGLERRQAALVNEIYSTYGQKVNFLSNGC